MCFCFQVRSLSGAGVGDCALLNCFLNSVKIGALNFWNTFSVCFNLVHQCCSPCREWVSAPLSKCLIDQVVWRSCRGQAGWSHGVFMVAGLVVNFRRVNILLVNLIICGRGLLKGRGPACRHRWMFWWFVSHLWWSCSCLAYVVSRGYPSCICRMCDVCMPLGTVCSGCVFESEKCHRERVDIRCCCCDCIGLSFDNRLPKEGRGFTGVKAAVIEYWNRVYCLQFFAAWDISDWWCFFLACIGDALLI